MGRVGPDEVEHDVGTDAVRRLAHGVGDIGLIAQHLVCAELAREPAPALVRVDPDDRPAPENANELDPMCPTPPTPMTAVVSRGRAVEGGSSPRGTQ